MLMTARKLKMKNMFESRITTLLPVVVTNSRAYLQASSLETNVNLWEGLMKKEYDSDVTFLLDKRKKDRIEYKD